MFTGLIEDIGKVTRVTPQGAGRRLTIRTALDVREIKIGASIAVNGVCLTAEMLEDDAFVAVAARETLRKTTLGALRVGTQVHLEQALRVGDRLDGHLVQGHVDGIGRVSSVSMERESLVLWIGCPSDLLRYVAPKGSITIDGVSLTVNELVDGAFRVNIVPHTARETNLGTLRSGASVNLELDVLAKYVERLLGHERGSNIFHLVTGMGYTRGSGGS